MLRRRLKEPKSHDASFQVLHSVDFVFSVVGLEARHTGFSTYAAP